MYNAYPGMVNRTGNPKAQKAIQEVFEPCDQSWRGLGTLPKSGLKLRKKYELFDVAERFKIKNVFYGEKSDCSAGEILKGKMNPLHCQAFGTRCTPEHPLGALMVSTEGACAAYYRYRR